MIDFALDRAKLLGIMLLVAVALCVVLFLVAVVWNAAHLGGTDDLEELSPVHLEVAAPPHRWDDGGYVDVRVEAGTAQPPPPAPAIVWPAGGEHLLATKAVEPVRENFRHWLEGGPDYCG